MADFGTRARSVLVGSIMTDAAYHYRLWKEEGLY